MKYDVDSVGDTYSTSIVWRRIKEALEGEP